MSAEHICTVSRLRNNRVLLPVVMLIVAFSLTSVQGILSISQTETTVTQTTTVTQASQEVNNYSIASLIVSAIGSGAVVGSLVFLAFQIKQQREDERFTVFEKLMSDFTQLNLLLVNHPQIADHLYPGERAEWKNEPAEKRMAFYYLDSVLGLCERAWTAGKKSKAEQSEWIGWRNWLKSFAKGPLFAELLKANEGMYEGPFTKELESILREANSDSKST